MGDGRESACPSLQAWPTEPAPRSPTSVRTAGSLGHSDAGDLGVVAGWSQGLGSEARALALTG